jgi:putative membrane protein
MRRAGESPAAPELVPAHAVGSEAGEAGKHLHVELTDAVSRRWPPAVYESGSEPDPRFSFANERTFLSWIRTALSLLAAGVAVQALSAPIEHHLRSAACIVLIALSFVSSIQAWVGWLRSERAMRKGEPLPAARAAPVLTAGLALVSLLIVAGLLLDG